MKEIDWTKTGVIYERRTSGKPIAKRCNGKASTRLQFKDGSFLTAQIYEASHYSGRREFEESQKVNYSPCLIGESRGKEIVIRKTPDGETILEKQTLGFDAMEIKVRSYENLLAWYNMIKETLDEEKTIEIWEIPE